MNEKSRLLKNTGLIAIGNLGAKMISFLLLPLYTSILSTSEYGTYDFIVAVSTFLLPIVTVSMHEAMFRFIIDTDNKGEAFNRIISNAFFAVLIGISVLGCSMLCIHIFVKVTYLLYIWLYVTAGSLYTFSNNMLRGQGHIKEYAIVSSCKNTLQLMLNVIVIAILRWGVEGLLFSLCISEVLAFIIVAILSRLWEHVKVKYLSAEQMKQMLLYSFPLIPNALCAHIINLSDRLVISGFIGTSANGIYSVAYKFPNMVETIYHYFYTAWSESASRVFAKGKEEAVKYYQSLYDLINNMMFSVILLMTAGMPVMFRIFVKGDYIQGFKYVPLLLFAMYFDSLAKFYSGLFTAMKKTRVMATSTIIAAFINVIINVALITRVGLYAAAGSTLIADMVLVIIRRKFITGEINLKINYRRIGIEIIAAAIVCYLYSYSDWRKISFSIVIAGSYALFANKTIIRSVFVTIKNRLSK